MAPTRPRSVIACYGIFLQEAELARGDGYDQLLAMWGIQDSLLQAYRSIFMTAESVVFAIGATITSTNPPSAIALAAMGLGLLFIWHQVCSNRALDVSFVHWMLARAEEGADIPAPFMNFKNFQSGRVITVGERSVWRNVKTNQKGKVNDPQFVSMTRSRTRRWMEGWIPLAFFLLWMFVVALAILPLL